jgi:hypothetical protein
MMMMMMTVVCRWVQVEALLGAMESLKLPAAPHELGQTSRVDKLVREAREKVRSRAASSSCSIIILIIPHHLFSSCSILPLSVFSAPLLNLCRRVLVCASVTIRTTSSPRWCARRMRSRRRWSMIRHHHPSSCNIIPLMPFSSSKRVCACLSGQHHHVAGVHGGRAQGGARAAGGRDAAPQGTPPAAHGRHAIPGTGLIHSFCMGHRVIRGAYEKA